MHHSRNARLLKIGRGAERDGGRSKSASTTHPHLPIGATDVAARGADEAGEACGPARGDCVVSRHGLDWRELAWRVCGSSSPPTARSEESGCECGCGGGVAGAGAERDKVHAMGDSGTASGLPYRILGGVAADKVPASQQRS
eukprot:1985920-Prymnesium_polylepis.1